MIRKLTFGSQDLETISKTSFPIWAIPENREFQKWKLSFFHQRHTLSMSFDIFVVTYRVINFLPKLVHMLLFSIEKTEFPFLVFPYFRVMPPICHTTRVSVDRPFPCAKQKHLNTSQMQKATLECPPFDCVSFKRALEEISKTAEFSYPKQKSLIFKLKLRRVNFKSIKYIFSNGLQ